MAAAAACLALAACAPEEPCGGVAAARSAATAACAGAGAHAKHLGLGYACETCHPCGGEFGVSGTLPDGTPVAGTITRDPTTSCAVSYHNPSSVPTKTVSWMQGPLTCVSCHTDAVVADARSTHAPGADRSACLACHDTSDHMSGAVRLVVGDGSLGNVACLSCHSGVGKPLGGNAPPVVVELGPGGADPHGEGGADAARPCLDCHDGEPGATDVVHATGDSRFRVGHSVQLPGLPPAAPQEVRVRTPDRVRNVGFSGRHFVTIGAPSTPAPIKAGDSGVCTSSVVVPLSWAASIDPNGDAVVYELQVSGSPQFETLVTTSRTTATTQSVSLLAARGGRRYYWRVRALETTPQSLASTWSWTGSVALYRYTCDDW